MNLRAWFRKVLHQSDPAHTAIERADHVLPNIKSVQIRVVPKNARALAELRRLESHVRR